MIGRMVGVGENNRFWPGLNPFIKAGNGTQKQIASSQNNFVPGLRPALTRDTVQFGASRQPKSPDDKLVKVGITLPQGFWRRLQDASNGRGITPGEYLQQALPHLTVAPPSKDILDSVSDVVTGSHHGKPVETKVTTLFGPEQIFDTWIDTLNQTQKYAQISMYNFENILVQGGRGVDGADISPGWEKQQQILKLIEEKARQGVRFQFILDNSIIRNRDEFGNPIFPRTHTNAGMIEYLQKLKEEKGLPIDVVAFPRSVAHIYHVKMLISDGKRAIVGGMNLSNHSAANWDACVKLEGPEVANLQKESFHPDWMISRHWQNKRVPLEQIRAELPEIDPVTDPAIQVLNTMPREYTQVNHYGQETIGDYLKTKLKSNTLTDIHSEQFIATHKELKEDLLKLHARGKNVKMLHSASVVDEFPYSRKTVFDLIRQGLPIRFYNEWEEIGQKLHSKWTVFSEETGKDNPQKVHEVLIGSANLSARGLETNLHPGLRQDYPNHPGQRYTRGNRDMAIVIKSPKIADAFLTQFNKDWEFSPLKHPPGYGQFEKTLTVPNFEKMAQRILERLS